MRQSLCPGTQAISPTMCGVACSTPEELVLCTVRLPERVMSVRSLLRVLLCCTHVLTDFFMHSCLAQDTEHPIFQRCRMIQRVVTGHRDTRSRTNTSESIAERNKHSQW